MTPGTFTDSGYRFRENLFSGVDSIFGIGRQHNRFYDVQFFSSDTLSVGTDHGTVAEMYFRVSVDYVQHSRVVYKFMDWLGAIGGVEKILMKFLCFMIGGYASFNSAIVTINQHNKGRNKCATAGESGHQHRQVEDQIQLTTF